MNGNEVDRNLALKKIFELTRDQIHRYVTNNSGSYEEAMDIQQEALIALYENVKANKFKGESELSTYVFSIAKFKWLNEIRRKKSTHERHLRVEREESELDHSLNFVKKEDEAKILKIFNLLGVKCRSILIQSFYHNASISDLVKTQKFSNEQVARNKKYKCIKQLKEIVKMNPNIVQILKEYGK